MVWTAAAVSLAFTLVVALTPNLRFAYRSLEAHVAIETAATLIGALAAYLFAGRARRTGALTDVVLAGVLTLLALTNLAFSLVPALADGPPGRFATWAPVAGRLLAGIGLVYAAFAPERRLALADRAVRQALLAAVGATVLIGVAVGVLEPVLPSGVDPALSPEQAFSPVFDTATEVVLLQLLAMVLYGAAAIGFLRRVERHPEQLTTWLTAALVLGAFARLNYFLFPSLYSEYVYSGDVLRLGFYFLLLVGATREIGSYQRRITESAVFQERRRLARELHDGLAVELAYITSQGRRAQDGDTGPAAVKHMVSAAERALDEARAALSALTRPLDEPLERSIAREAQRLADRADVELRLAVQPRLRVPDDVREALLRIVREAVNNAVKHAEPEEIVVKLESGPDIRLTIADDGRGFDPGSNGRTEGFGLVSMRERAELLGGTVEISSEPGSGTQVVATLPSSAP